VDHAANILEINDLHYHIRYSHSELKVVRSYPLQRTQITLSMFKGG
jgi:hypothetical protein